MELQSATKRIRKPATSSPSLPGAALHNILRMLEQSWDVLALLHALRPSTLPPELLALRDLGAAVALADHWPLVHVTKIPVQHARLAIAALPAFKGIYVDPGFAALAWLDATLPPHMPVSLYVDPKVPGAVCAFAHAWGSHVVDVIVKGRHVQLDPIPDVLARCVNVESVTIKNRAEPERTATYLAAIPTTRLRTLEVLVFGEELEEVSAIVAWLQGPTATSLTLACDAVRDPTALARAIQASITLTSLRFVDATDVQRALVALPHDLHHMTSLAVHDRYGDGRPALRLLQKLDSTNVLSFSLELAKQGDRDSDDSDCDSDDELTIANVLNTLAVYPALASVRLVNARISAVTTVGVWPQLTSAILRRTVFKTASDIVLVILQLSTSRCLRVVDLSHTELEEAGFVELARALPAWMARGLQTLVLSGTGFCDDDVVLFAVALASGKNRRPLTINLTLNRLGLASLTLLLSALSACRNVALHVETGRFTYDMLSLAQWHELWQVRPGVFMSPPQTSSLWHSI
ncbi:hypothetical protein SDRG_03999 [Saprolegnia diclina VS20]|uniref:F-box domain-containing protein n=1 Tax=Saprolegnia diclina (strain VS20) TaxID=1156394 RepID=T0QWK5_SAPDV|nr:hypothetical protein SDRG_03999 [Saprolegnia diclina VS20]EQC39046.1 hypothetical protein SDRG_03999 [Saprolegnia diclina VS20]|eukprot:XP_008607870.1 hypothetical protein SDRG_03999 [Saprolegnia diclina VS20]